jgi:hypothetical protein
VALVWHRQVQPDAALFLDAKLVTDQSDHEVLIIEKNKIKNPNSNYLKSMIYYLKLALSPK